MAALRDLLALELPATFKRLAVRNYVETFYNISDDDKRLMEQELMSLYGEQVTDAVNIQ